MNLCEVKSLTLPKQQQASLGWSTTADIFHIREKHAMMLLSELEKISSFRTRECDHCNSCYGPRTDRVACACKLQASINKTFHSEFSRLEKTPKRR